MQANSLYLFHDSGSDTITSTPIAGTAARRGALASVAGSERAAFLQSVDTMLERLCASSAARWHYHRLSNGGFYMTPASRSVYCLRVRVPGVAGELDARTAGLLATAMAYTELAFRLPGVQFSSAYLLLSRYIHQQPRGPEMRAILDGAPG